ncbi:hypothetical protein EYR40_002984 [Pleurotus pulmonarius]|nr:hypothetical protein EYR40_002984 [Pleurotus pulmonarius]
MSSPTTPSKPPITSYHSAVSDSTVVDESGVRNSLPSLPKGAAMPAVLPGIYVSSDSPPSTPSQRLLDTSDPPSRRSSDVPLSGGGAPSGNVQFTDAEKPEPRPRHPNPENFVAQDSDDADKKADRSDTWVPLPLRTWFWLSLVIFLAGGAIALEVALHFSNKNQGWATKGDITDSQDVMHYVYALTWEVLRVLASRASIPRSLSLLHALDTVSTPYPTPRLLFAAVTWKQTNQRLTRIQGD